MYRRTSTDWILQQEVEGKWIGCILWVDNAQAIHNRLKKILKKMGTQAQFFSRRVKLHKTKSFEICVGGSNNEIH